MLLLLMLVEGQKVEEQLMGIQDQSQQRSLIIIKHALIVNQNSTQQKLLDLKVGRLAMVYRICAYLENFVTSCNGSMQYK